MCLGNLLPCEFFCKSSQPVFVLLYDQLLNFSFIFWHKRIWPEADNFDEEEDEEKSDMHLEDLHPIDSTGTGCLQSVSSRTLIFKARIPIFIIMDLFKVLHSYLSYELGLSHLIPSQKQWKNTVTLSAITQVYTNSLIEVVFSMKQDEINDTLYISGQYLLPENIYLYIRLGFLICEFYPDKQMEITKALTHNLKYNRMEQNLFKVLEICKV